MAKKITFKFVSEEVQRALDCCLQTDFIFNQYSVQLSNEKSELNNKIELAKMPYVDQHLELPDETKKLVREYSNHINIVDMKQKALKNWRNSRLYGKKQSGLLYQFAIKELYAVYSQTLDEPNNNKMLDAIGTKFLPTLGMPEITDKRKLNKLYGKMAVHANMIKVASKKKQAEGVNLQLYKETVWGIVFLKEAVKIMAEECDLLEYEYSNATHHVEVEFDAFFKEVTNASTAKK